MDWVLSAFADEASGESDQQIKALQAGKVTHIDVRGIDGHSIVDLPEDKAEAIQKKFHAAGIRVNMFGSPIGKIDVADDVQLDLDRLRHLAKMKPIFGCNAVRVFSYYNRKAQVAQDAWQAKSLEYLKQLKDLAGELGLVLYHENERHIFGDRLDGVLAIVNELRDPPGDGSVFRAIFDFDNYNQSGDDVWANWEALKDQTDAFHLKDSTAPPNSMHVPIGEGNGQAKKILADAAARGWSGCLSLEPHLSHSKAVMATGPSGQQNQALADMTAEECFQLACETAHAVLGELDGVKVI